MFTSEKLQTCSESVIRQASGTHIAHHLIAPFMLLLGYRFFCFPLQPKVPCTSRPEDMSAGRLSNLATPHGGHIYNDYYFYMIWDAHLSGSGKT